MYILFFQEVKSGGLFSLQAGYSSANPLGQPIKRIDFVRLRSECIAVIAICNSSIGINEPPHSARRAYSQTLPAVKTGHPLDRMQNEKCTMQNDFTKK